MIESIVQNIVNELVNQVPDLVAIIVVVIIFVRAQEQRDRFIDGLQDRCEKVLEGLTKQIRDMNETLTSHDSSMKAFNSAERHTRPRPGRRPR